MDHRHRALDNPGTVIIRRVKGIRDAKHESITDASDDSLVSDGDAGNSSVRIGRRQGLTAHLPEGASWNEHKNELIQVYPQLAKTHPDVRVRQSAVITSSDPRLLRQEYKFHQGALYELQIHYDVKRLPRGPAGLLARLKEVYGPPSVEGIEEFDLASGILSGHRTVWNDGVTRVTLAERERIRKDGRFTESVLALTDLTLERQYQQAVEEHRRQQELEIPIPLPEGRPDRSASSPWNGKLPS